MGHRFLQEDEELTSGPIAFIAAMRQEIKPFLKRIGPCRRDSLADLPVYRFELFGRECFLFECGIGRKRAAEGTAALIKAVRPALLVSFGVSGAVTEEIGVGDVIIGRTTCYLANAPQAPLMPLAFWSDEAVEAAARVLSKRGARLYAGTVVTTRGEVGVHLSAGSLQHPILDMETAAIAQVAAEQAIPLLSMRSISDSLDEPLPFNIPEAVGEDDTLKMGRIFVMMLRSPKLVPRFARFQRNMSCATVNLVEALAAALMSELSVQESS